MARKVKNGTWISDLIEALNNLGGVAFYKEIYKEAKKIRELNNRSWTPSSEATIRRTIEDHSSNSENYRGLDVFYTHNIGSGKWGLRPQFITNKNKKNTPNTQNNAYQEGLEGLVKEIRYLKKSRNIKLAEQRKIKDKYTCQACGYLKKTSQNKFVIDVHHINPLGNLEKETITSINDLICLCPNCHRIAHSKKNYPLSVEEIKHLL